ncbi:MAG: hypothetical protein ACD_37C00410G0001, partial [uncultured bacterium]
MVDYGLRSRRQRTRLRSRRRSRLPNKIILYSKLSRYALFALVGGIIMMVLVFLWFSR